MPLVPLPMDEAELASLLRELAGRVEVGDSYEGTITWELPDPPGPGEEYDPRPLVRANYRVGNQWGQGSVRMFGNLVMDKPEEAEMGGAKHEEKLDISERVTVAEDADVPEEIEERLKREGQSDAALELEE